MYYGLARMQLNALLHKPKGCCEYFERRTQVERVVCNEYNAKVRYALVFRKTTICVRMEDRLV